MKTRRPGSRTEAAEPAPGLRRLSRGAGSARELANGVLGPLRPGHRALALPLLCTQKPAFLRNLHGPRSQPGNAKNPEPAGQWPPALPRVPLCTGTWPQHGQARVTHTSFARNPDSGPQNHGRQRRCRGDLGAAAGQGCAGRRGGGRSAHAASKQNRPGL